MTQDALRKFFPLFVEGNGSYDHLSHSIRKP